MGEYKKIDSLNLSKEILSRRSSVRIPVVGSSMYPLFKKGDVIFIEPVDIEQISISDVIVCQRGDRMYAHRLMKKYTDNGKTVLVTKGDTFSGFDEPLCSEDVLGKVTAIERKGRRLRINSGLYGGINIFCAKLSPFGKCIYPPLRKIKAPLANGFRGKRKIEDEYLVSLCQSIRISEYQKIRVPENQSIRESENRNGFDWEYILDEARRNGVSPILYLRLKNQKSVQPREDFPETFFEKLEQDYYQSLKRNMLMWEEIRPILESFKENGIKVILLKGVALAELVYKNLALRPMSDVDLLVKKEELPRIDEKMRDFGYSTGENYRNSLGYSSIDYLNSIEYRNKVVPVHFHWHLVNSTLPTFMYASKIDMEGIWKEAIPVKISGIETLSLAPHHLLIHLSEHASKPGHSLSRLILLCDIAETIKVYQKELNWELLIDEARKFNLDRPLYYSLYLTSRVIGLDNQTTRISEYQSIRGAENQSIRKSENQSIRVSEEQKIRESENQNGFDWEYILDELRPKNLGYWERRFIAHALWNRNFPGLSYLLHLAICQGIFQKIRFIWQSFFPPSEVLTLRYPFQRNRLGFHLKRRLNQSLSIFHSICKAQ